MTKEREDRVEFLFHEALDRPREERDLYLETEESDPEIVATVKRLIEYDDDTEADPISERLASVAQCSTARVIGRYRLLQELGVGGMGTVFLAERDIEGRPQQVALKVLRGVPNATGKRRMARERSILAGLNHPNIARHIDGGESAEGQPYLVMDYVDGLPLPSYLKTTRPSLTRRLELFLHLCDAVQHAHQRLVLHRDIKPSNVVVRDDGTPVLLDFGVGALLEEGGESGTVTRAFTPGYSAPEQRSGQAETTVTDVFGLGALLFDLLTDKRHPEFCKEGAAMPAPSRVSTLEERRRLHGDLDYVVAKATHIEPERRYSTVAELSEDVRRYLGGFPVTAGPDSALYRLTKFVLRHRTVAIASVAMLTLGAVSVWKLDIERARALEAERTSQREAVNAKASRDFLVSVLAEASPEAVRGQTVAVSTLLSNAAAKLRQGHIQDPRARAMAWMTVAEVYADINDPKSALAAAETAFGLVEKLDGGDLDIEARASHVRGLALIQLERAPEARDALNHAIDLSRQLGKSAPVMARMRSDYGTALLYGGAFEPSEQEHRKALELLDAHPSRDPLLRTRILLGLARTLYHKGDIGSAARFIDQARAEGRRTLADDGFQSYQLHRVAMMVRHAEQRYDEALEHAEQALSQAYRVYGEKSRFTADMELYLGALLDDLGRSRTALSHYHRSQQIAKELNLSDAIQARDAVRLAMAHSNLSDHDTVIALTSDALRRMPDDPVYAPWRIRARYTRALSLGTLGRYDEADEDLREAVVLSAGQGDASFTSLPFVKLRSAEALMAMERYEEAGSALAEAAPVEHAAGSDPKAVLALMHLQARLDAQRGDMDAARRHGEQALALARKHYLPDTLPIARIELDTARIAIRQDDQVRGRELLDLALPVLRRELDPRAAELVEVARLVGGATHSR
ncbi:serine/threonine-protein kinase [Marilutibacter maris]|uniref:Protein kinase domain-containing protein n=1 Tax=Marilutibacter maris TaxID=1605891 RepID=A0A2U9TEQ4_9GAMM|nr:serine/threonine-protein kinase [Lysobacter maris]AWV08099.1 hypothetical protein C9I47_2421 [Lysobacter maris]